MAGGGQNQNIYQQSSNAYSGAMANTNPAAMGARTAANMNPYAEQVTNRTMQDMNRQRQMTINDIGASATAANAFGGSRHGVAEAETNAGYGRAFGDMAANMNMNNFTNAQNLSQQQGQQLQSLSQQGFDMGNTIGDRQMREGIMQQGMNQSLIDAARGQWSGFANAPAQSLQYPLAALGTVPHGQTQTTEQQPGLFNYLSLGLGLL